MLYLLKSYGSKGKLEPIYKVGYTNSLEKRLNQYFSHNPFIELISVREGDEELEKLIHVCLYSLEYKFTKGGKLDEWFIGDLNKIQYIFHSTKGYLEKVIWRNRDKAFSIDSISNINSDSFKLLRRLYKENNYRINGNKYITKDDKVIKTNTSDLDILFYKLLLKNFPEDIDIKDAFPDISIELEKEVQNFLDTKFYSTGIFEKKMKMYCEFRDIYNNTPEVLASLIAKIPDQKFHQYYEYYGTKGCSSRCYKEIELYRGWKNITLESQLEEKIKNSFKIGEKYSIPDIKEILNRFNKELGISKKAKATDLENYFKLFRVRITLSDGKIIFGYRLDSL